ncbi:hypothetical protein [Bacillus haynesii]|nr:hypothetical protein [Bacillus haynesii]MCY7994010.1 hypothetical protein [Bacillus haynesii]
MRKENVKIQEVVVCDGMFVKYPYYIRSKEGSIKEGEHFMQQQFDNKR